MKREITRISPLRAATIGALVYGLLICIFTLISPPFLLLATILVRPEGAGIEGPALVVLMLLLYPVLGSVMGGIWGLLSSAIDNLVVRWTGGRLLYEVADISPRQGDAPA